MLRFKHTKNNGSQIPLTITDQLLKPPYFMHKAQIKWVILVVMIIFFMLSANSFSATIPNFKANYYLDTFGIVLGKVKNSFSCQNSNCTLVSRVRPTGLAAMIFKNSSVETIQLTQTDTSFNWLNYYKLGIHYKKNQRKKQHIHLSLDKSKNLITYLEGKTTWPARPYAYDIISIIYAIQYHKLNNRELESIDFYIQGKKLQEKLQFKTLDKPEYVIFEFANEDIKTLNYVFESHNAQIELWLLANYHYFPAKIRITNQSEKRTITLTLMELPKNYETK